MSPTPAPIDVMQEDTSRPHDFMERAEAFSAWLATFCRKREIDVRPEYLAWREEHGLAAFMAGYELAKSGYASQSTATRAAGAPFHHGMTAKTEVDRLAILLFKTFAKTEPDEGITKHPASYWATFAELARAVIADRAALPAANDDTSQFAADAVDIQTVDLCMHVLRGNFLAGRGPDALAQLRADIEILEGLI